MFCGVLVHRASSSDLGMHVGEGVVVVVVTTLVPGDALAFAFDSGQALFYWTFSVVPP